MIWQANKITNRVVSVKLILSFNEQNSFISMNTLFQNAVPVISYAPSSLN